MGDERCRDCALYDLQAVLSKNGRVLSGRAARCLWVSTEVWPSSVSQGAWGQSRPRPRHMEPNDGAGCPCFTPRTKDHPNA
jgi:hypothetical protein